MSEAAWVLGLISAVTAFDGTAQAQGLVRGAEQGAARGDAVAGRIGGGAVGAGVGGVTGALGLRPRSRRVHHARGRCADGYRHRHHHHCR